MNVDNLAAVPSVIFGLLGLAVFVRFLGFGQTLVSAAMTLALLILPTIVISSREALRAVPQSVREASFALGATRWQTVFHQTLPAALPTIATGVLMSLGRVLGSTAPLLILGAVGYITYVPDGIDSPITALPVQVFSWISRPQAVTAARVAAASLAWRAKTLSSPSSSSMSTASRRP